MQYGGALWKKGCLKTFLFQSTDTRLNILPRIWKNNSDPHFEIVLILPGVSSTVSGYPHNNKIHSYLAFELDCQLIKKISPGLSCVQQVLICIEINSELNSVIFPMEFGRKLYFLPLHTENISSSSRATFWPRLFPSEIEICNLCI